MSDPRRVIICAYCREAKSVQFPGEVKKRRYCSRNCANKHRGLLRPIAGVRNNIVLPVTDDERTAINAAAKRDQTSTVNYIRRGINNMMVESGDDALLLRERKQYGRPKVLSPAQVQQIKDLRLCGLSWRHIANRLSVPTSTVHSNGQKESL